MSLLDELYARYGRPQSQADLDEAYAEAERNRMLAGPQGTGDVAPAAYRVPKRRAAAPQIQPDIAPPVAAPVRPAGDPTAADYDAAAAEEARAKLIAEGKTGPASFTPDQAAGGPRIGLLAQPRIRPRITPGGGDPAGSPDMGQAGADTEGYKGGAPLMGMLAEKEGYTGAPYSDPNGVDLVANQPLKPGDPLPPLDAPITVPDRPVATGDVPQGPSTELSAARGPAKPGPAAEAPDPFGKTSSWDNFLQRLTDNRGTLLALAGGFAGARNIGEGMSRAFSRAAPIAAVESQRSTGLTNQRNTYKALIAKGVSPAEALAAATNPTMAAAVIKKYYETGNPLVVNGRVLQPQADGSLRELGDFSEEKNQVKMMKLPDGREVPFTYNPSDGSAKALNVEGMNTQNNGAPTESQQRRVQAILEGREAYPAPNSRSPDAQFIREQVHAADPNFDAVNFTSRQKTRNDFTSGKSSQNLTAFNTAIGHLEALSTSVEKLNNSNYPLWNKYANQAAGQLDPKFQAAQKEFATARTAVSDELTRAFRGSGGNVHDIKQWEAAINEADSPAALRSAIKQAAELLRSRIDSVGDQYNRGMGTTKDPLELLNPKAREAFERLHGQDPFKGPGKAPAAAHPAQPAKPAAQSFNINGKPVTIERIGD